MQTTMKKGMMPLKIRPTAKDKKLPKCEKNCEDHSMHYILKHQIVNPKHALSSLVKSSIFPKTNEH